MMDTARIPNQGRLDPIAYTYEADYHCPACAGRRFGVSDEGWIPEDATDREGNPVGAVAPWDEWQQFTGEPEVLACGTCGTVIKTYEPYEQEVVPPGYEVGIIVVRATGEPLRWADGTIGLTERNEQDAREAWEAGEWDE